MLPDKDKLDDAEYRQKLLHYYELVEDKGLSFPCELTSLPILINKERKNYVIRNKGIIKLKESRGGCPQQP